MKKIAVIVAGGVGARMNHDLPKQFLLLKEKPVLYHAIAVFFDSFDDIDIILVLPEEHINKGKEIITSYFTKKNITIVAGGSTRFYSVKNGLHEIKEEAIVFVHDAARCLVSKQLLQSAYDAAMIYDTAIPVIDATDSLRVIGNDTSSPLDRNKIKLVQTPQVFKSALLLPAFEADYDESFTDESTVVESMGYQVHLIKGETQNIKITNPIDLLIAEKIMEERS